MITSLLLSSYLISPWVQDGPKVKEIKLVQLNKTKVASGSIALSKDFMRYAYASPKGAVFIDGKALGTYPDHGTVIFSGNSDDYAFIAQLKEKEPPVLIKNGKVVKTEGMPARLFRTHDLGPIAYLERMDTKFRLVTDKGTSPAVTKLENLRFSDDGETYAFSVTEETRDTDGLVLTSKEMVYFSGNEDLVPRPGTISFYPANNSGFLITTSFGEVRFRGRTYPINGRFNGRPVFAPDGKGFGFRNEITAPSPEGNIELLRYNVNGNLITDIQRQQGLTFSDDSNLWVLCGLNGKSPYIYHSAVGPVKYSEFPGLDTAPQEPYKWAKFRDGKLMLLFQGPRANPTLFLQDIGLADLGTLIVVPDSISISPDGRFMVFGGQLALETHAFVVDLHFAGPAVDLGKTGYDLQMLGPRTFAWTANNKVNFAILRDDWVCRAEATL